MAIALGLLDARQAAPDFLEVLEKNHHDGLRGYIAVALGLMNNHEAADRLRAMLQTHGLEWRFRLNLARGLGLMNDTRSVKTLVELLGSARTVAEASSMAQAIGLIGDKTAIAPLIEILEDRARSGQLRGFCAVALGLLADKTPLPWNACISVGLNYRSKTEALAEILDIL
jgi:HEAT repeat protein